MRVAVDSNVLAYAEGVDDPVRQARAIAVIDAVGDDLVIPVQAIGELVSVLVRKGRHSKEAASARANAWSAGYALAPTQASTLFDALAIIAAHNLQIWDAIILAAASEARCELLLSEDMHHGFTWNGVTVVNPFTTAGMEMLERAFEGRD